MGHWNPLKIHQNEPEMIRIKQQWCCPHTKWFIFFRSRAFTVNIILHCFLLSFYCDWSFCRPYSLEFVGQVMAVGSEGNSRLMGARCQRFPWPMVFLCHSCEVDWNTLFQKKWHGFDLINEFFLSIQFHWKHKQYVCFKNRCKINSFSLRYRKNLF